MIYVLLILCLLVSPVHAASLLWDAQPTPPPTLTIERGDTATGPFSLVATIPGSAIAFMLTPGHWGFYRIMNGTAASNVVRYSVDLYSAGVVDRLDLVEGRVTTLEGVTSAPYTLSMRRIDPARIELTCAGTAITTTDSGLRRIVECLQ